MNRLHQEIIDMLKYIHMICVENHIDYSMLGGTMLGAVRHEGFIPWDDDADIGIMRKDITKFTKIVNNSQKKYRVVNYADNMKVPFTFLRIENIETTLIENDRETDYIGGVYIDIFPLDGCPKDSIKKRFRKVHIMKNLHYVTFAPTNKKRNFFKCYTIKFLKMILNSDKIAYKIDKYISRYSVDSTDYVCNYLGRWEMKEAILKSEFLPLKLYRFETIELYGVSNPKSYLTSLYGDDYMIPPEDKGGHHLPSYLNYDLPCAEYKKGKNNEN